MSMKPSVAASNGPHAIAAAATTTAASGMPEPQSFSASGPRTLDSRELFGDQPMVLIRHWGEVYRLQTTRQGKLILTK